MKKNVIIALTMFVVTTGAFLYGLFSIFIDFKITPQPAINTTYKARIFDGEEYSLFLSIQSAIDSAENGQTIELIRSHSINETIVISKEIQIVVFDESVNLTRGENFFGAFFEVTQDGDLTLGSTGDADLVFDGGSTALNLGKPFIVSSGNLSLNDGVILRNNFVNHKALAVHVLDGQFTLNGASIISNKAHLFVDSASIYFEAGSKGVFGAGNINVVESTNNEVAIIANEDVELSFSGGDINSKSNDIAVKSNGNENQKNSISVFSNALIQGLSASQTDISVTGGSITKEINILNNSTLNISNSNHSASINTSTNSNMPSSSILINGGSVGQINLNSNNTLDVGGNISVEKVNLDTGKFVNVLSSLTSTKKIVIEPKTYAIGTKVAQFDEDLQVQNDKFSLLGDEQNNRELFALEKDIIIGTTEELEIILNSNTFEYTSVLKQPVVTVKLGLLTLIGETDYTLAGDFSATNAGSYDLQVVGKGIYANKNQTKNWEILPNQTNFVVSLVEDNFYYNQTEITPVISSVTAGSFSLLRADYTINTQSDITASDAGNYTLTLTGTGNFAGSGSVNWKINPKPLDAVLFENATYMAQPQSPNVSVTPQNATYNFVSGQNQTFAGEYLVTIEGSGNYCGEISNTWQILPKEIVVTWDNENTWTYDGFFHGPTLTSYEGIVSNDLEDVNINILNSPKINAGEYEASVYIDGELADNYIVSQNITKAFEILKSQITFVEFNNSVYNQELQYANVNSILPSNATFDYVSGNEQTNAGIYEVKIIANGNYDGELIANWQILKANVEVGWSNTTLEYNAENQIPTAQIESGVFLGDDVELVVSGEQKNAGEYVASLILSGQKANNYEINENSTCDFEIVKKGISVSWTPINALWIWDGESYGPDIVSYSGIYSADISLIFVTAIDNRQSEVGTYVATAVLNDEENYSIFVGQTKNYRIIVANLSSVTFENATYNGENQTPVVLSIEPLGATFEFVLQYQQKNAGTYQISVQGNGNYAGIVTGEWEISKTGVIVLWEDLQTTYNGTVQKPTLSLSGIFGNDDVFAIISEDVILAGEYVLHAQLDGIEKNNYEIILGQEQNFEIEKRGVVIEWSENEILYNGQFNLPTAQIISGKIANDDLYLSISGERKYVGSDYEATASLDGTRKDNYYISSGETSLFSITQTGLSILWSQTIVTYNGETQSPQATISNGVYGEDDVFVVVNEQYTNAGSYTVTASINGLDKDNYYLQSGQSTDFVIEKLSLTISWQNTTLVYNAQNQQPTASINELVISGDDVFVVVVNQAKNAGMHTIVCELDGFDKENYDIAENKQVNFTIQKAEVVVNANETTLNYNSVPQLPQVSLSGVLGDDIVFVSLVGEQTDVGGPYIAQVVLSGEQSTNYTATPSTITFEIIGLEVNVILVDENGSGTDEFGWDYDEESTYTKTYFVTEETKYAQLPQPTRSGYIFKGWWTDDLQAQIDFDDYVSTSTTTFYANWVIGVVKIDSILYEDLQSALVDAQNGDIIYVLQNFTLNSAIVIDVDITFESFGGDRTIIRGNFAQDMFTILGQVTLNSQSGNKLIFDGNKTETQTGSIIKIMQEGSLTILENVILRNNYGTNGGAIQNFGSLTISNEQNNPKIYGNTATNGGGVYNGGTIIGTFGGDDFEIYENSAVFGGAVYNLFPFTFGAVSIHNNTSSSHGGAIYNLSKIYLTSAGIDVFENVANGNGIFTNDINNDAEFVFEKGEYKNNSSFGNNGALITNIKGSVTILGGVFENNYGFRASLIYNSQNFHLKAGSFSGVGNASGNSENFIYNTNAIYISQNPILNNVGTIYLYSTTYVRVDDEFVSASIFSIKLDSYSNILRNVVRYTNLDHINPLTNNGEKFVLNDENYVLVLADTYYLRPILASNYSVSLGQNRTINYNETITFSANLLPNNLPLSWHYEYSIDNYEGVSSFDTGTGEIVAYNMTIYDVTKTITVNVVDIFGVVVKTHSIQVTISSAPSAIITLNANGGVAYEDNEWVWENESYIKELVSTISFGTLPSVARENYIFEGWFSQIEGGEELTSESIVPDDDTTYYARWIVAEAKINSQLYEFLYQAVENSHDGDSIFILIDITLNLPLTVNKHILLLPYNSNKTITRGQSVTTDLITINSTVAIGQNAGFTLTIDGNKTETATGSILKVNALKQLTMQNVILTNNHSMLGGAIINDGTLILNNVTLSLNSSNGSGHAMINNGTASLTDVTISNNTGENLPSSSGVIYNNGEMNVTGGNYQNNSSLGIDGALFVNYGTLNLTNISATNNFGQKASFVNNKSNLFIDSLQYNGISNENGTSQYFVYSGQTFNLSGIFALQDIGNIFLDLQTQIFVSDSFSSNIDLIIDLSEYSHNERNIVEFSNILPQENDGEKFVVDNEEYALAVFETYNLRLLEITQYFAQFNGETIIRYFKDTTKSVSLIPNILPLGWIVNYEIDSLVGVEEFDESTGYIKANNTGDSSIIKTITANIEDENANVKKSFTTTLEILNDTTVTISLASSDGEAFVDNGWTWADGFYTKVIDIGVEVGELPKMKKADYVFDGYYTEQTNGTELESTFVALSSQTFYVHWLVAMVRINQTYYVSLSEAILDAPSLSTIVFVKNEDNVNNGEMINLSKSLIFAGEDNRNIFIRNGNAGIFEVSSGVTLSLYGGNNGSLIFGASSSSVPSIIDNGDVTYEIYPRFEFEFDKNGMQNEISSVINEHRVQLVIPQSSYAYSGSTIYVGYQVKKVGGEQIEQTEYNVSGTTSAHADGSYSFLVSFAQESKYYGSLTGNWLIYPTTVRIYLNASGGTHSTPGNGWTWMSSSTYYRDYSFNSSFTSFPANPTREERLFQGWVDVYGNLIQVTDNVPLVTEKTYYAKWSEQVEARIETTYYQTVNQALESVASGQTIVLLKNIADYFFINIKTNITFIAESGRTIYLSMNGLSIWVYNSTVTFGGSGGTIICYNGRIDSGTLTLKAGFRTASPHTISNQGTGIINDLRVTMNINPNVFYSSGIEVFSPTYWVTSGGETVNSSEYAISGTTSSSLAGTPLSIIATFNSSSQFYGQVIGHWYIYPVPTANITLLNSAPGQYEGHENGWAYTSLAPNLGIYTRTLVCGDSWPLMPVPTANSANGTFLGWALLPETVPDADTTYYAMWSGWSGIEGDGGLDKGVTEISGLRNLTQEIDEVETIPTIKEQEIDIYIESKQKQE